MTSATDIVGFIRETRYADLPPDVAEQARVCVIDLVAAAAGGFRLPFSRIVRDHAARHHAAGDGAGAARVLFDGRRLSPVGAALANGAMIDSFDAHDGHAGPMGHAGVALFPALLASADRVEEVSGRDFLCALAVGYEVALRAGLRCSLSGRAEGTRADSFD